MALEILRHFQMLQKTPQLYIGIDINNDLLAIAQKQQYSPESQFYCTNILESADSGFLDKSKCSYVIAAGLFNFNFQTSSEKVHEFAFAMIERMISLCTKRVVIDFMPRERID